MRLKSLIVSLTVVGAMAMPLLYAAPAQAQATRTWVSGVGDDVNPCSRTAPCKTWAGAISKTANGGEIDALDPGGFGGVTITKSMTLDGGGGQVASTLVAGVNGIVVNAQPTDVVVIRNVRFQGVFGNGGAPGNSGQNAIRFIGGLKLVVDNCDITGFALNGIDVAVTAAGSFAAINNTRIENVGNAGVLVESTGATSVQITDTRIYGSKFGLATTTGNKVSVYHSVASNASNAAWEADGGASLFIDNSVASHSATGILVGGGATVALGNNDIVFNTTGIGGGGTASSYTNNRIFGNTSSNGVTPLTPNPSNPSGQN